MTRGFTELREILPYGTMPDWLSFNRVINLVTIIIARETQDQLASKPHRQVGSRSDHSSANAVRMPSPSRARVQPLSGAAQRGLEIGS